MHGIKVSIVIPVYNVEKYISECLDSLLRQTYLNYEIILVDDGSPDGCGKICDEYAERDERIHVVHKENGGVSAARNTGIQIATGEYITFVDPDDWVEATYLEDMLQWMKAGGLVAGRILLNNAPPIRTGSVQNVNPETAQISVFSYKGIYGFSFGRCFDRNVINKWNIRFHEDIAICEDSLFNIEYLSHIKSDIMLSNHALYHYRRRNDGAVLGRYEKNFPDPLDFTEITALNRAEKYLIASKSVKKAWRQRRTKAAQASLRTMISCNYDNPVKKRELLQIIRRGCLEYLAGKVGASSSKISVCLSAVSPMLEWKLYKLSRSKQ